MMKSVLIIALVAVVMIGMITPSSFAVQTIQGNNIPQDVPYGCISQDVMSSNKSSQMNISLRSYTPNPDVNVVIQADGKIIKNQSIPIKTWTPISAVFKLPNYSPGPGGQDMKLTEIKICLLNTSTNDGEKSLRLDSIKTKLFSKDMSTNGYPGSSPLGIFKVSFDKSAYHTDDKVKIILEYPDYNNKYKIDSFGHLISQIVNISTKMGALNNLTLTETGINTGVFTTDILLDGPDGHISYDRDGISILNGNNDTLLITITDESNKIRPSAPISSSASASISPDVSKTDMSKSLLTIPAKTILDCTPNSIYVPNKTSKYFLINIENPDDDKCTYNVNLYDQNNLKIETLGIMIFSEAFVIDETTPNGNYYITLISSDHSYSESFPLNVQHTISVQKLSSPSSESSPNTIVLIIIPIIVTVVIVIVFVSKKKSKRASKKNFY